MGQRHSFGAGQAHKPAALFCGSDLIALGAMSALEEAGLRIPEDISVIGIDDISFASLARPPLTSIRVPREAVGATAFEALDRMMKLKRRKGADYYLATELVLRRSTASGAGRARQPKDLDAKAKMQKDGSVKPVA